MIVYAGNVWFWGTLLVGMALSLASAVAAYTYNKNKGKRDINETYFSGPAKSHLTSLGIGIPLAPILLSEEVQVDVPSLCLLSASALLMLFASALGLWLYSVVQALPRPRNGAVTINSPVLIAAQGVILSWLLTAIIAIIVFLFVSPILGPVDKLDTPETAPIQQETIPDTPEPATIQREINDDAG